MRNLVAGFLMLHGLPPLITAPVENKCQTFLEAQSLDFLVVHDPRPSLSPVIVRNPNFDCGAARIVDIRFQLSSRQYKKGLLIQYLLARYTIALIIFADCVVFLAQFFQIFVNLLKQDGNRLKIGHCRMRFSQSSFTALRTCLCLALEACQSGTLKLSAISKIR